MPEPNLVIIKVPKVGIKAVVKPKQVLTDIADRSALRRPIKSLNDPQIMAPTIIPMNVIAAKE